MDGDGARLPQPRFHHLRLRLRPGAVLTAGGRPSRLSLPHDRGARRKLPRRNHAAARGPSAQVEHGSANPTGYATIGTGRNVVVVVGDTLANTLVAAGYALHREWYINDRGAQIARFGASLYTHYCAVFGVDVPLPPGG